MSPTANTSGWPGSVRSGSVAMRPARSTSAPLCSASIAASGEACTPAAQTTVRAAMRSVPSLVVTSTPFASMPVTRAPILQLDAESFELARRAPGEIVAERRQRFLAAVDQEHAHRRRVERAELAAQSADRELADLPRDLDAGRARADDDDRQPVSSLGGVGRGLGHLERAEDAAPELERVVDRLHARRMQRELVVAEVRLPGAGGDDQAVVRDLEVVTGERRRVHDPAIQVEAGHLGELDAHVLRPAQDVPQRRRDLTGREDAGRDLVQQRLEQVVVAAVDQRDVDRQLSEEAARRQPAEAAADDDDAMPGVTLGRGRARDRARCASNASCRSRRTGRRALLGGSSCGVEVDCRVDEREMRERLREVPELLTVVTDLLGEQPEVIART